MSQQAKSLPRTHYSSHLNARRVMQLIIVGLICYLIIAGFGGLQHSLAAVRAANGGLLIVAFICIVLSYGAAALTYVFLTPRPLRFWPTLWVEISGGLVNRLLPGGLGGLGINGFYLHRRGYTVVAAASIVTTNNLFGFVGNALLLAATSLFFVFPSLHVHLPRVVSYTYIFGCSVLIATLIVLSSLKIVRIGIHKVWGQVLQYIILVIGRPFRSCCALLSSCCLTGLHTTALLLVIYATHVPVDWPVALLAISVGAFTGAVVPTPGGVGGAEAGIAGLLVAFGMASPDAVAAAVIYRGLTYWLPLLPGYIALRIVEKRYL